MRTAIFIGLTAIADAINKNWFPETEYAKATISIAFIAFIIMDALEFIKKMRA